MQFDHTLWGQVVPDGSRFCHWGGRALSQKLAHGLTLRTTDVVLDLCCGEGGLTDFLQNAEKVVGIDISEEALKRARATVQHHNVDFVTADARILPFSSNSFNIVLSQDADAWMYPDKTKLMREIARVTKPGGTFLWQSYVSDKQDACARTNELLRYLGYSVHDVPKKNIIRCMFEKQGFKVQSVESLHEEYANDNRCMISRARDIRAPKELLQLLEWEEYLFKNHLWSGVLVIAQRSGT